MIAVTFPLNLSSLKCPVARRHKFFHGSTEFCMHFAYGWYVIPTDINFKTGIMEKTKKGCSCSTADIRKEAKEIVATVEGYTKEDREKRHNEVTAAFGEEKTKKETPKK